MNSTPEWWSIDDTSLHQFGWAVTTFGGARYDLPPRRGDNITLPYRAGQVHRAKQPDQRIITLTMFLVGMVPATGAAPPNNDHRLQFNNSWEFLRRLVWKANDARVTLGRRWLLSSPTVAVPAGQSTLPGLPASGTQLLHAWAPAEMSGTMTPTMTGRQRADFQMDFTLADPYFYGPTVEVVVPNGDSLWVYNAGNDTAINYVEVEFFGTSGSPLKNPIMRNLSPEPDLWLKFTGSVTGAVTLNVQNFTAVASNDVNHVGQVSHKGARHWFGLQPGLNKLTLASDTNSSGYAKVRWRPPYV